MRAQLLNIRDSLLSRIESLHRELAELNFRAEELDHRGNEIIDVLTVDAAPTCVGDYHLRAIVGQLLRDNEEYQALRLERRNVKARQTEVSVELENLRWEFLGSLVEDVTDGLESLSARLYRAQYAGNN
jgi:hypothetical protein